MFTLLIAVLCLAMAVPLHRLLKATMPRRLGTLRPKLSWLTAGLTSLTFFALSGLLLSATPFLGALRVCAFLFGTGAIAFFAHRRIHFRRCGAYEFCFGIPVRACRYSTISHCEAGKDIIREGVLLRLKSGAAWGVPGLMPTHQLAEVLGLLQQAGLDLPDEEELRIRLGMDYSWICPGQPMRP